MGRGTPKFSDIQTEKCLEKLKASQSFFIDEQENVSVSIDGDGELTRVWRLGVSDNWSELRYFLQYFTDVKNVQNVDTPTPTYSVDGLVIANNDFDGIWRNAYIRRIQRTVKGETYYYLAQTLRQGWCTKLEWDENRKKSEISLPGNTQGTGNKKSDSPEKYVLAEFPNISPFAVDVIISSLTTSYTAPVVQGETLAGIWHVVTGTHDRQSDGSSIITLKLAMPQYTLEAFSNWGGNRQSTDEYLWNVPKDIAQTIITAEKSRGKTVRPSYRGELVDIVISTSVLDSLIARYDSLESSLSTEDTIIYENMSEAVNAPARSQGSIYRTSNSLNANGGYDARLVYDESYEKSLEFLSESSAFRIGNSIIYKNSRSSISAPETTGSGSYRADQNINEDGSYDGRLIYMYGTGEGEVEFISLRSNLKDEIETIYRDSSEKIEAPDDFIGGIYRASNSLTEDGLYNARSIYSYSKGHSAEFRNSSSAFKNSKSIIYKNSRALIETPEEVESGVYHSASSFNNDGTYDGTLVYVLSDDGGIYEFESMNSSFANEKTSIYKSVTSAIKAPDSKTGVIYHSSNSLTEDGLYDARMTYSSSEEVMLYKSFETRYGTAEIYMYKNQRIFPSLSFLDNTKNNSVSPSFNNDGTYDVSIVRSPFENGGSGATDFWEEYAISWRYYNTDQSSHEAVYMYQTRRLDYAQSFLADAITVWTGKDITDLTRSSITNHSRNRWTAHYVAKFVP